jgi:transcription initiation factor TFIIIB Brf1 subunit/transcription initiation factor TFIIB
MDCPICGTNTEDISTTADGLRIVCSTCGEYDITSAVLGSEQWQTLDPEERFDVLKDAKRSAQPNARPVIATYLLASSAQ